SLKISYLNTCVYWLSDKEGTEESKILHRFGINITIIGEWTYSSDDQQYLDCYSINNQMFRNIKQWFPLTTTYSTLNDCCQHQINECLEHHSPNESGENFVKRVLGTCSHFRGKISQVLCRTDLSNGRNIINRIKVVSGHIQLPKITIIGCQNITENPFITSNGIPLFQTSKDIVAINVEKGLVFSISSSAQTRDRSDM
ncbi:hypothetical protein MXB_5126, partial [Myxobolus squamalis]